MYEHFLNNSESLVEGYLNPIFTAIAIAAYEWDLADWNPRMTQEGREVGSPSLLIDCASSRLFPRDT
jgi:hypothetical protein